MNDVLADWEVARHGTRGFADAIGPESDAVAVAVASGNALATALKDSQARAGQCRACRTMGGQDVRCDACADSGMVAEVARLREDAAEWKALAGLRRATGQKMLAELEQMVPAIKALEAEAKTARHEALRVASVLAFGPETRTKEDGGWWRVLVTQSPGVAGGGSSEYNALMDALMHAGSAFTPVQELRRKTLTGAAESLEELGHEGYRLAAEHLRALAGEKP